MSLDINITVEGLQSVTDAIMKLAGAILAQRAASADEAPQVQQIEPAPETPAASSGEPEQAGDTITRAMVREMFVKAAQHPKVKREELKELLADCGAESVSTLPENRFAEVYAVLSRLAEDVK